MNSNTQIIRMNKIKCVLCDCYSPTHELNDHGIEALISLEGIK